MNNNTNDVKSHISIVREYLTIVSKLVGVKKKLDKNMFDDNLKKQYDILKQQEKVLNEEYKKSIQLLDSAVRNL